MKEPERVVMNVGDNGEMIMVGVGSYDAAIKEAVKLTEDGIVALELCAGFGIIGQAKIKEAVKGKCIVGAARFDVHPGYDGISGDDKWL